MHFIDTSTSSMDYDGMEMDGSMGWQGKDGVDVIDEYIVELEQ